MHESLARQTRVRVFTKWANAMLLAGGYKSRRFTDILSNLTTGVDLCLLVSALKRKKVKPVYSREEVRESILV